MNIPVEELIGTYTLALAAATLWATRRTKFVVEASADENPWGHTLVVEATNRGSQPATLKKIEVVFSYKEQTHHYNLAACFPKTIYLPIVIPQGGT